jgi:hypothetical protein
MFWSKDDIVERLSKIPRTLEDVSIEIFDGVPPVNDFLQKISLSNGYCTDVPHICRNPQNSVSLEQISIEKELVHPYVDGSLSNEFAVQTAQYQLMLPYEILGINIKKEYKLLQPEELKIRYPIAYNQILEAKCSSGTEKKELNSDCYRLENESFLQYMNTPKIIIGRNFRFQASYDPSGNHVFADAVGVVLGDPTLYHYITAVFNSSVSKAFPEILNREGVQIKKNLCQEMLKKFPIMFPKSETIESVVSTISRYLIYLNRQKNMAVKLYPASSYQNLIDFYKRIADILILDTYVTNDLDPKLLDILEENITPCEERFEYSDDVCLLIGLESIKKSILDSPDFKRCRFSNEFTNILATLKNNSVW